MKLMLCLVAVLAVVVAEDFNELENQDINLNDFRHWMLHRHRTRRQLNNGKPPVFASGSRPLGGGKVFGELGPTDNGLYGKGGYERNIFNDHRGKLDGHVTGTRVLSPYGDSSHLGGGLNWKNDHAAAAVDVSRQIHGQTSLDAQAGGRWPVGRNGEFNAGGTYHTNFHGRPDYGVGAGYRHKF